MAMAALTCAVGRLRNYLAEKDRDLADTDRTSLFAGTSTCWLAHTPEIHVTRDQAIRRIEKLLALAAIGSGATEEESRTAAVAAVRLMSEHGLAPRSSSTSSASAIDLDAVASLSFRVIELENLLGERQRAHTREICDLNVCWTQVVACVREEERAKQRKAAKSITKKAATKERTTMARSGGKARARSLDYDRKREIGRMGAQARWARWRERHGVEPQ
jgi:hypothetical protein